MQTKTKISLIIFLAILILTSFFRLWQIWHLPSGLYSDESMNGLDALDILSGKHISVFYEANYGREGLFFYLIALSIKIFGVGVWQLKIVSACISLVSVVGLYLLAKQLFSRTVALLATLFAAVSVPATILARVSFRANLIPFVLVFLFYFIVKALRHYKNRYFYSLLAGTFLALGFYTYISFRIVPVLLIILIVLFEIVSRRTGQTSLILRHYKKLLVASIAFAITIAPLAVYFWQNPDAFIGRSNDVSILNPALPHHPLYYAARNLGKTLIMFNVYGDANWRHNVSGSPFFDPATGILFIIGVIASLLVFFKAGYFSLVKKDASWRKNFIIHATILGCFLTMLVPMIASEEGIPHFLRSIGIMPIVFLFPAFGIKVLFLKIRYRPIILSFLLLTIIVFVVNYNLWLYFVVAKNSYGYYTSYYGDLTLVSKYINTTNVPGETFLVLNDKADRTTRFLTSPQHNPYQLIMPNEEIKTTYPHHTRIIFPSLSFNRVADFQNAFPEARLIYEEYNQFGNKAMEVYSF